MLLACRMQGFGVGKEKLWYQIKYFQMNPIVGIYHIFFPKMYYLTITDNNVIKSKFHLSCLAWSKT